MNRYRKKPIEVEAIQYVGKNFKEICRFTNMTYGDFEKMPEDYDAGTFKIHTLEGDMEVSVGDYIIKGVKGEFYPCKPDIFDETYDLVNGRQKLPNTECPICHGILEDEYEHTIFKDFHTMGCFKCGHTITFEDVGPVLEEIYKQRIDMLPDVIRNMHRNRRVKE